MLCDFSPLTVLSIQMVTGMGHDGQALGQDVGHIMNEVEAPQRSVQTWEGVRNGDGQGNESRDTTGNPWGMPTPVAAGMEHQSGLDGFGMA